MNKDANLKELLSLLSNGLSDEELLLTALQCDIAATITDARVRNKMTQKDLASQLGVTQALVSRWESGDTNYSMQTLVRIAQKLNIQMKSPYVSQNQPIYSCNGHIISPSVNAWNTYSEASEDLWRRTDGGSKDMEVL